MLRKLFNIKCYWKKSNPRKPQGDKGFQCLLIYLFMCASFPDQIFFFSWGPLASKNCCVIWIFAYLLDSLCFSKHSLRKLSIHFFIWLTYSLTYGKFVYLQVAYIWTCNAFEAHAWVEVSSSMYIFNTFIDTVSVFYSKIINLFFLSIGQSLC